MLFILNIENDLLQGEKDKMYQEILLFTGSFILIFVE